jgi:hypothetical protein
MALGPGSFHSSQLLEKATFRQGCHLKEIFELVLLAVVLSSLCFPSQSKRLAS